MRPIAPLLVCLVAAALFACGPAEGPAERLGESSVQPRVFESGRSGLQLAGSVGRSPSSQATESRAPLPALVVDLHVDTVTAMASKQVSWADPQLEASLPALQAGGVNVVVQAAWIPRAVADPRGVALGKVKRIRNMVLQSGHAAALVTGPDQLERVVRSGRIAVVIALEGGTALTAGRESLEELRSLGLSMVGLTWSESSPYADSSAEPRAEGGGLTELGRQMVKDCNDLGILLDVSHMSDRATAETVALSRAPVLASHSNARALCDVPRNLPDSLLQAIARKGGLVGAMFHGPFVVAGGKASRSDVVKQVKGLVERVGAGQVGIGSDWDGIISCPTGLGGSADLPALRKDLGAAGLSEGELDSVFGGSFLRLWGAAWEVRATSSGG